MGRLTTVDTGAVLQGYSATFYSKLPVPKVWHPLVGSMVMSATALVVPETLFLGYQGVDKMLNSDASLYSLAAAGTLLVIAGTKGDRPTPWPAVSTRRERRE